jgi:uncharacterized protein (TIGR00288 family)
MKARYSHIPAPRTPAVPVHRGPQALTHGPAAAGTTGAIHHAPNAALLIDFDNVTMGIRSDLQTELRNLLSSAIIQGKVAVQRAYADWRRYPQYIVPLSEASIDLIFAPAYGSSKKNATDIRLAIDALELVFTRPEIGTFILLSGDSDFSSLVIKLKEYGKYVIGVGIRESSSDLLVQNCDEYYSYNALAGLVKSGDAEPSQKWDPWELVTEAIERMQRAEDVMRSDRLKQVMQEIDASFDEKDLGFSKFSKFCQEASRRGLIRITKLENGQLEVRPPDEQPAQPRQPAARPSRRRNLSVVQESEAPGVVADAPGVVADAPEVQEVDEEEAEEAAAPRATREGRTRRGRRGGRGRKRPAQGEVAEAMPDDAALPTQVANDTPVERGAEDEVPAVSAPQIDEAEGAPATAAPKARTGRGRRSAPRTDIDESIGASGVRLTRDEAMQLVRDAVAALLDGDDVTTDEAVRRKVRELLGRDSESLSARNFARILRDAHDSDLVDIRRRGDGFEVSRAVVEAAVADQLEEREEAARAAEAPDTPAVPAPRGMGARARSTRGRSGRGAGPAAPPPELLMVGVVDDATPVSKPVATTPDDSTE